MPRAQSSDFLERIIPAVRTGGARNIVELARFLNIPVETTRYKVKGMLKRGLSVHANVDYNKFGLINHEAYFTLRIKNRASEKKFFQSLADHAYLTSYARELPNNRYVCTFAVPVSTGLYRLFRGLTEEGLVESSHIEPLSWKKGYMIQPVFFHLKRGTWQIDWSKLRKESRTEEKKMETKSRVEFDDLDLLIARILERDALVKLSEIAKDLKTTLNNVFYHFHKHILDGKLIDEFMIRWDGTSKQESVFVQLWFDKLNASEEKTSRSVIRRLPFLWSDALSTDTGVYICETMIPTNHYLQTLQYLSDTLGDAAEKVTVRSLDPKSHQQFPIPAHLFRDSKWKFDPDSCVESIVSRLGR